MTAADPRTVTWSKHRVEALTDGIFAVAMTLLVIELKVPDPHTIVDQDQLVAALLAQGPKAASWIISFFVLAIFWISHHRLMHYVRTVDTGLLWRNLFQLAFVALMPFSAALIGEFGSLPLAQIAYDANMVALGLMSLIGLHHVRRHPELASHPMEPGTYHATLLRIGSLVAAGIVATVIAQSGHTAYSTLAYLAMIPIGRHARRIETAARASTASTNPTHP